MPRKSQKPATYTVDWLRNGFCYRTTVGVPKDALADYRKTARLLGEKLKVTKD